MFIDLHVHTLKSSDSSLAFDVLAREARRIGLDGVCLTEHDVSWEWREVEALSREHGIRAFPAMEVSTDMGHVAVFGLRGYRSGMSKVRELRRIVDGEGGFMIAMHPFRRLYDTTGTRHALLTSPDGAPPPAVEAMAHELFGLVDDIEIANGGNTRAENGFAGEVARLLGRPGTGGSDAHSAHGLGCFVTCFEATLESPLDLVRELHAGRYAAMQGLLDGRTRPMAGTPAQGSVEMAHES